MSKKSDLAEKFSNYSVQLGRLDSVHGLIEGVDPCPNSYNAMLFFSVDIYTFRRNAKFKAMEKSKAWWDGGLQSQICHSAHIVTQDLDEGIFIIFYPMNAPAYARMLGRLLDENDFFDLCVEKFSEFEMPL